jgi:hypothetical protein
MKTSLFSNVNMHVTLLSTKVSRVLARAMLYSPYKELSLTVSKLGLWTFVCKIQVFENKVLGGKYSE